MGELIVHANTAFYNVYTCCEFGNLPLLMQQLDFCFQSCSTPHASVGGICHHHWWWFVSESFVTLAKHISLVDNLQHLNISLIHASNIFAVYNTSSIKKIKNWIRARPVHTCQQVWISCIPTILCLSCLKPQCGHVVMAHLIMVNGGISFVHPNLNRFIANGISNFAMKILCCTCC